MNVGDILVYIGETTYNEQYFTKNKFYIIYKIDNYHAGVRCCWIKDDVNSSIYFKEREKDDHWQLLKDIRKQKIIKINKNNILNGSNM